MISKPLIVTDIIIKSEGISNGLKSTNNAPAKNSYIKAKYAGIKKNRKNKE